ncbi:MAG: transcriptional regulator, AraC family [Paenibacillus sp.]|jgi:AraC-like DNA-binding protein|nr:transcriptional regulator, AraC family [Paenibacillus sp.]
MDLRATIQNELPRWSQTVEDRLAQFPVCMEYLHWCRGTSWHRQPGLEFHVIHEGRSTLTLDKLTYSLAPRHVMIFNGNLPHQWIASQSYRRTLICAKHEQKPSMTEEVQRFPSVIDYSWIPLDTYCLIPLDLKQYRTLNGHCEILHRELRKQPLGWQQMALAQVMEICVLLRRAFVDAGEVVKVSVPGDASDTTDLIQRCMEYVCLHLEEDLSLNTVARKFYVSEGYLTRRFRQELSISFYQYVLLQRVTESKRRLCEMPDVAVSEISGSLGFPSPSHFNRSFKSLVGETPSSYRHRMSGAFQRS